ncbi:protein RALF-like 24 [Carica papaya]|uniref:protein RALF-like 24 n=1 Tax=Carica papaya TaxID=3649 RepID=UPI000B8D12B0|nr:protein RALF-like 24 [Carica papaya]
MSAPKLLLLLIFFFFLHTCNRVSVLALDSVKTGNIDVVVRRARTQSIEDCLAKTEPEMDSETSRRVLLMQKKYISYETLKRDMVPCIRPGASYYDCQAGVANPYNRGCEMITRCARGIKDIKN